MTPEPTPSSPSSSSSSSGTPLVRRRLLALGGTTAVGAVAAVAQASSAQAAPATQPWLLGGTANVASNGTNFIGPTNVAPIIFKTTTTNGVAPVERARIIPAGRIGVGVTTPVARLEVAGSDLVAVQGTSTATTSDAVGVKGVANAGTGVRGTSTASYGVSGSGGYCGVRGDGGSYGVLGSATSTGVYGGGSDYGVFGSGGTVGVYGTGTTNGVKGASSNPNEAAVLGDGGQYGVHGINGRTAGTRGDSGYVGAWGQATAYGVYGLATDPTNVSYGLFGQATNGASWALYAQGNARVTGTLSKSAGSFRIDHPLDPEHRWLSHSFVESPDMMNVYNGLVVLDAAGRATVTLPEWFEALNRDFRYQLTPVGGPAPRLHVAQEVTDGAFRIAGGSAGLKVSWQLTGIRQDAYAVAHPILVEEDKTGPERGTRSFVPRGAKAKAFDAAPRPAR